MEKKRNSLKILLLLVIVIAAAVVLYNFLGSRTEHSSIGESSSPAVDFTVTDQQGNSVSLSDMKGRPVIINFWASWCSPCRSEMPHFDKMYKEYGNEIQFMMVNLTGDSETVDTASSYIESEGYSFPVYYDTDGEGASAYSVYSIPATYLPHGTSQNRAASLQAVDFPPPEGPMRAVTSPCLAVKLTSSSTPSPSR